VGVLHDGSIVLSLVSQVDASTGKATSSDITIHTTGRINYKFAGHPPRFIPCLMDLAEPMPVARWVVRAAEELPAVPATRGDDAQIAISAEGAGSLAFTFFAAPAVTGPMFGELCRFGVEGLFALVVVGELQPQSPGMPAFRASLPAQILDRQAVEEPVAYLRFKKLMFAADLVASLGEKDVPPELIEFAIQQGPGLYPPNSEGVWTIVTAQVMRDKPRLDVSFDSPRYRAEVVELRPGDVRLATVRVRFRVIDNQASTPVKSAEVGITGWSLDAEL
jgi:hypothetical protein